MVAELRILLFGWSAWDYIEVSGEFMLMIATTQGDHNKWWVT
jgi:hypothetical protein